MVVIELWPGHDEVMGSHLSRREAHDLVNSVHGFNHHAYMIPES